MLLVLCISNGALLEFCDSYSLLVVQITHVRLPVDKFIWVLHMSHDDLCCAKEEPYHLLRQTAEYKLMLNTHHTNRSNMETY